MPAGSKPKKPDLSARLLAWYDVHRRVLPWRAPKGKRADPYRIWLSEIMLQQTTVQAVGAYYRKFLTRWPDVRALADASQDEVLAAWAGLGYYARARNLHAAAKLVAHQMGGKFPATAEALRALPGVGGYTAGAIAAIAYDEKQAAMDANAERVIARLHAVDTPMPKAKSELHALGSALVPDRAGDFVQALMDLGSAICTPKRPACPNCPWTDDCRARKLGIQEQLPVKAPKMVRPLKRGAAFVARDRSGAVLLVKRPDKGLLASMLEPPLGAWSEKFPSPAQALKQAPFEAAWKKRPGIVRHGFTHFELEIEVYVAQVAKRLNPNPICHPRPSEAAASRGEGDPGGKHKNGRNRLGSLPSARETRASPGMTMWVKTDELYKVALPTVMRKIVEHGLDEGGPLFAAKPRPSKEFSLRKP
jgi:A/G-specific adenine glycosylase